MTDDDVLQESRWKKSLPGLSPGLLGDIFSLPLSFIKVFGPQVFFVLLIFEPRIEGDVLPKRFLLFSWDRIQNRSVLNYMDRIHVCIVR